MLLSQILEQLQYGELSLTNLTNSSTSIGVDEYPALVALINLSLTELHKRFPLKLRQLTIQQMEGVEDYLIATKHTVSMGTATNRYIIDTAEKPYEDDLLVIDEVLDEVGNTLALNNEEDEYSLFTPSPDILQIPYVRTDNYLTIIYRAKAKYISASGLDPATEEVSLPHAYLEPLLLNVASRHAANMLTLEGTQISTMLMQKYQLACKEIEQRGLINRDEISNTKLENNGWV